MSYQSEERYWTDYVRVATPIVGLLLLLGVFWYWANSLIGADSSEPPPTAVLTVIPDDTPTPTETTVVDVDEGTPPPTEEIEPTDTPDEGGEPATRTPRSEPSKTPEEPATEEPVPPTDEPSCDGTYEEGQSVEVSSGDVRLRSEPTTASDIVATYNEGEALVVINCTPQEGDGYVWWQVRNEASDEEGWVAEDWLRAAES